LEILKAIAGAMRAEFGAAIDAHPGGIGTEAGVINRTLRISARVLLEVGVSNGHHQSDPLRRMLHLVAMERLDKLGVVGLPAEQLLDMEPSLGDALLAYLALVPPTVIDDLLSHKPD
jgi:hypothetical protein